MTPRIVPLLAALVIAACGGGDVAVDGETEAITAVPISPSATVSPSATPTEAPSPTPAPTAPPTPAPTSPTPTSSPTPPPPSPTVLTADDSGGTFRLAVGATLLVRLGEEGMRWSDLSHTGDAVSVHERLFLVDPGYREWEVTGITPGESVLTSTGGLPCHDETPPCLAPSRLFEVTIIVE